MDCRRHSPVFIVDRQGVFRFQPHRGDRVADFVGEPGRQPADGRQALRRAGASAFIRKTRAGGVERMDKTIEFALAGARQSRQVGALRIVHCQRRFKPNELARPAVEDTSKPHGRAKNRQRQDRQSNQQLIVGGTLPGEDARHRPGGNAVERALAAGRH